ncbi:hypothetical protein CEUSTIGMA_g2144.t1 [Chlamydomonas eustigma]|uniref:Elongator complex protein 1 n=1 Tax=Chlamydomonas eustigma TaxID=1157962 RepID=A0A250WVB1_9CHLO|nr:hypothetical protein CEUSTIGMA_g2144.t1 [Chlamydomonas eustigma]|eukprot:GAX74696.1 hypothetical protein CEUSTIGMA_g2144.t1 [Chlamydomonas eustigma]
MQMYGVMRKTGEANLKNSVDVFKFAMPFQEWEVLSESTLAKPEAQTKSFEDASISWRGDGKYFATSIMSSGSRSIKVWDRVDLSLHAEIASVEGILPALSWQPNGRHLYIAAAANTQEMSSATTSRCPNAKVLMYERNGLPHGGFDVPTQSGHIHSLQWSLDSELLAIVLNPGVHEYEGASRQCSVWKLQIWHRRNWHWYLKQERVYAVGKEIDGGGQPVIARWDEQEATTLHVLHGAGCYQRLDFMWQQCVSDWGTCVVVDGKELLLTPLRHITIPPPMCAARVLLPSPPTAVCLSSCTTNGEHEMVAAALSDGRIAILASVEDDLWEETLEECGSGDSLVAWTPPITSSMPNHSSKDKEDSTTWLSCLGGSVVRALCWLDRDALLALVSGNSSSSMEPGSSTPGDVLVELSIRAASAGNGFEGSSRWELCEGCGRDSVAQSAHVVCADVRTVLHKGFTVLSMVSHGTTSGAAVLQGLGGQMAVYLRGGRFTLLAEGLNFQAPCPLMSSAPGLTSSSSSSSKGHHAVAVGLSLKTGKLYWGSSLVASEVTSFAVRTGGAGGPALLYTTRKSLLYTVYFEQLLSGSYQHRELLASSQDQQQQQQQVQQIGGPGIYIKQDENRRDDDMRAAMHAAMKPSTANAAARDMLVRAVEQGSELVAVPRGTVTAVLQMPRGNLESMSPRALVLAAITQSLDCKQYAEAWRLAGSNRVDLNLIVDYRWPTILHHMPAFMNEVPGPSDLCDLLFAIHNGNVTAQGGPYSGMVTTNQPTALEAIPSPPSISATTTTAAATAAGSKEAPPASKVNAVCDAIVAAVEGLPGGREKYLNVIVTAFARKEARQLDMALACIRDTKEASLSQGTESSKNAAERALKHLLLHVDADELYRVALGMYSLPLAYMVIANAQALALAKEHKLLRYLLNLVCSAPSATTGVRGDAGMEERRAQTLLAYGVALEEERKYEDAGVAYMAAGEVSKALQAYRSASQWRMVFVLARRLDYSEPEMQKLAVQVSDELASSGQPAAGAQVLLQYLGDVDNAVSLFTQAREWREALHTAYQHQRVDLVETVVTPAAAAAASGLLSDAKESIERIAKYGARLREVRGKRLAMEAILNTADGIGEERDEDAMTDVNSMMTGLSMYTENTHTGQTLVSSSSNSGRTGPASTQGGRRAQHAHKKGKAKGGKIRQGSPKEEISLVELLSKLHPTSVALQEAGQLGELLILVGSYEDARTLQHYVSKWISTHEDMMSEVSKYLSPLGPHSSTAVPAPINEGSKQQYGNVEWKWAVLRDA